MIAVRLHPLRGCKYMYMYTKYMIAVRSRPLRGCKNTHTPTRTPFHLILDTNISPPTPCWRLTHQVPPAPRGRWQLVGAPSVIGSAHRLIPGHSSPPRHVPLTASKRVGCFPSYSSSVYTSYIRQTVCTSEVYWNIVLYCILLYCIGSVLPWMHVLYIL